MKYILAGARRCARFCSKLARAPLGISCRTNNHNGPRGKKRFGADSRPLILAPSASGKIRVRPLSPDKHSRRNEPASFRFDFPQSDACFSAKCHSTRSSDAIEEYTMPAIRSGEILRRGSVWLFIRKSTSIYPENVPFNERTFILYCSPRTLGSGDGNGRVTVIRLESGQFETIVRN